MRSLSRFRRLPESLGLVHLIVLLHNLRQNAQNTQNTLFVQPSHKKNLEGKEEAWQNRISIQFVLKGNAMTHPKPRQVRTTLRGVRLAEFDALIERLGLTPSGVLKLAVRRLAQSELQQNQAAPLELREAA
jgi:hypothetical protein